MTDAEILQAIYADMQGMKTDMQGMKTDMQGMKTDMQGMKTDMQGMKTDMQGMKTDMQGMKTDIQGMKTDMQGMKTDIQELNRRMSGIELTLENETNRNIKLLAENYGNLIDKLNQAIKVSNKTELYEIQVNILTNRVDKMEKEMAEIKQQIA